MLDLAGLPLRREERGPDDPLLIAGGSGSFSPEPMAEVFDLFLPGDGEVTLPALLALLKKLKAEGVSKDLMIRRAALDLPFVYAPSLYRPEYNDSGRFEALRPLSEGAPQTVRPGLVEDLGNRLPDPPDVQGRGRPRRYYRITNLGRAVVKAEVARLREVLGLAETRDLLPEGAGS